MSVSNSPPEVEITTSNKPRQSTNFSIEEDNIFISAWLNTSIDVVHGNEQKQETFHEKNLAILLPTQSICHYMYYCLPIKSMMND